MTQPPNSVKLELIDKSSLRKELIKMRRDIESTNRQQWDQQIGDHLLTLVQKHSLINSTVGVFSAIQAEPQLNPAYAQMHALGIKLALPIVMKKNMPLQFSQWTPNDLMVKDDYGISIPANFKFTSPNVLLIPCVGFNQHGYRLGYGGGFYDRTLAVHPRPLAVGIAYQLSETKFEATKYDIAMDMIITENGITSFIP